MSLVSDPSCEDPHTPWAPGSGVPRRTVVAFTLVQLACLGLLVWVKDTDFGVLFPVLVALLAPLRLGLPAAGRRFASVAALGGSLGGNVFDAKFVDALDHDDGPD